MPDTILKDKVKDEVKTPKNYNVVIYNDDYTHAEFVVDVLKEVFKHSHAQATAIMMAVHMQGKGVVGTYSREIAEAKMQKAITYARSEEHPLMLDIEEV